MTTDPVMRPDPSKNPGEDDENTVSSAPGAKARPHDKRPEAQYSAEDRAQGVEKRQPGGAVNIGVKGGEQPGGAAAAGVTKDKATGAGSRDSPAMPRE